MQFHTPESHEAKELTHRAYERIRSNTASPAEERELEEFQRRVNAYLAPPPGTDRIKDFPEQSDDRQDHPPNEEADQIVGRIRAQASDDE
jgi:hypothetical protein